MPKKTSIILTTMLDPISGRQVERAVCQHPGCNKTFSQKSDAKRHYLNVHQGRKFACEICSKTFSSREMVRAHTQNVHENKRWECTQCAKVFRWQCNFIKHKCRGQPLIKKHKCPYCKRAYAHVSGLSRHKRTCKRDVNFYPRDYRGKEVTITIADPHNEKNKSDDRTTPPTGSKKGKKKRKRNANRIDNNNNNNVEKDGLNMLATALNSASPIVKRKLEKRKRINDKKNNTNSGSSSSSISIGATALPDIPSSFSTEILL